MPNKVDEIVAIALLKKVMTGEPLTLQDMSRWAEIITIPTQISSPKPEQVQELLFGIRQALTAVYFPKQQ